MDQAPIEILRQYTLTELGIFIGVVLTSVTGTVVAIITAWRTGSKVDSVADKVDEVHILTNSTATRQKDEIAVLTNQVTTLTARIAEQEKNRAVLAAEHKPQLLASPQMPLAVHETPLPEEKPGPPETPHIIQP